MHPRPLAVAAVLLALAGPTVVALPGCAHDYVVENRSTPIHVWLSAPELSRTGGRIEALIYVGSDKVVEGPVSFPAGVSTVMFPTIRGNVGTRLVQVVLARGSVTASQEVVVKEETWIHVTFARGVATIANDDEQPVVPR